MTNWDGRQWIPDAPTAPRRRSGIGRLFGASAEAALITLLMFGLIAGTTLAAKGGRGAAHKVAVECTVAGNVVSSTQLPTDQLINFMVTDASGTDGWVLGYTWEGAWAVTVPDRSGPTTYEFASRTWGNDGAKYTVFASCSAG